MRRTLAIFVLVLWLLGLAALRQQVGACGLEAEVPDDVGEVVVDGEEVILAGETDAVDALEPVDLVARGQSAEPRRSREPQFNHVALVIEPRRPAFS